LEHQADVLAVVLAANLCAEADPALLRARTDDFVESVESAPTDEQDVGRIDLYEFLIWVLTSTLWRNRRNGSFDQLQQRLLHAFARNIPGNRRVIGFARDFVDLVDVNDPALGFIDVVVALLQQFLN